MNILKKGLDSYQLKILALIFMTFDHIAYFFMGVINIPFWFHIIGRISAPIFIFIVANGFLHTSNRLGYMKRLYLWSVLMAIGNQVVVRYVPHPEGIIIINNIFATMFYIILFLYAIEEARVAIKNKQFAKSLGYMGIIVAPFILGFVLMGILFSPVVISSQVGQVLINITMIFLPTPFLVEGSILWILLGIGFYYCLNSKMKTAVFYTLFSLFFFASAASAGMDLVNLFYINAQWLMILALPFILLYNGQKGKGMKYFFYAYYPAHVYLLYLIGVALLKY